MEMFGHFNKKKKKNNYNNNCQSLTQSPFISGSYREWMTGSILKDGSHPLHGKFQPRQSGRRYKFPARKTKQYKDSVTLILYFM